MSKFLKPFFVNPGLCQGLDPLSCERPTVSLEKHDFVLTMFLFGKEMQYETAYRITVSRLLGPKRGVSYIVRIGGCCSPWTLRADAVLSVYL